MLKYSREKESTDLNLFLEATKNSLRKYDAPAVRLKKDFFKNEDLNVKEVE